MSYHRLQTKPLNATLHTLMKRAAHVGLGVGAFTPILALANPTGGQVVAGQATIAAQNSNSLLIKQASQSAIINWQQFSIGAGQYVQFLQPSSSSVVLNRVVGGNASSILGSLSANGQVFLVNPNGIFFGKGASLDVQGIVASTLGIADSDFMSGNYAFTKGSGAADAQVVNQGSIHTHNGGYVVLAGDYSENDGLIQAQSGHVVLASGARTTLTLSRNSLVNFAVDGATLAKFAGTKNSGSLIADGGTVIMTADVANALKATVVNNTGLIEAHAISKDNGAIYLSAAGGNIVNAGTLDADAATAGLAGGNIVLKADGFTNLTDTSKISATGMGADGGNLEVSGRSINVRGSAKLGKGGNMLLDPGSMSIVGGASSNKNSPGIASNNTSVGKIGVGFIEGQLNAGANVAISAAHFIHNGIGSSKHISSIAAAGTGNLSFKVGTGGAVELTGVTIAIGGTLTASMGYGSFGFIQAKSVALNASHGGPSGVTLHKASTSAHGAVTKYSVKATGGDVDINGARVFGFASGGTGLLAISAKGTVNLDAKVGITSNDFPGGLTLVGAAVNDNALIRTTGDVNVTAGAGAIDLTGSEVIAHNVNLTATGGGVTANQIAAAGALTVTDATGNVTLGNVAAYGGALTVTDTTGNMNLGVVSGGSGVTLNDGAHTLTFTNSAEGNPNARAHGELLITAGTITQTAGIHNLFLSAGTTLKVNGQFNLPENHASGSVGPQVSHNLELVAGSNVKLDHSIAVPGGVTIRGGHLVYTGAAKTYSISAGYGNLILDASIGSAAAAGHAKFNVDLVDQGYGLFIEKSIYTGNTAGGLGASITAREIGHHGTAAAFSGVLAGNSYGGAVTVSAGGSVLFKGWNVGVGDTASHTGNYGAINVAAGQNLKFSGSGTGAHGGHMRIHPANATASNGKVDTSILVQAHGNIILSGTQVDVHAGTARADIGSSHNAGTASANLSFAAGGNFTVNGGASANAYVHLTGQSASASGKAFGGQTHKATATSNLNITAGGNINVTGTKIVVAGGFGVAKASANEIGANMAAVASATVFMKAKTGNITLAGGASGSVIVAAGSHMGYGGHAEASGSNDKATAAAHGDVTLNAGAGITVTGRLAELSGGSDVGFQGSGAGFRQVAKGVGSHAAASYDATADLSLKAGAGGINITGSGAEAGILIHGGAHMLNHGSAYGDGADKATATASGRVLFNTTGDINLHGGEFVGIGGVSGGYLAAARTFAQAYEGGSAAIAANAGVNFTARNVNIGSVGGHTPHVYIEGGAAAASGDKIFAQSNAVVSITGDSRVDINASGNFTVTAASGISILGGGGAAAFGNSLNHASNGAPHATLTGDAGVSITAAGAVSLTGAHTIDISGGYGAARVTSMRGDGNHALGSIVGLSEINITAGGSFTAVANKVELNSNSGNGGEREAYRAHAAASHSGAAKITGNASLSLSAANITVKGKATSGSAVFVRGGASDALQAFAAAGSSASAAVAGLSSINLTTKGVLKLSANNGGNLVVLGGNHDASHAFAAADGGKATVSGTGGVNLKGGSVKLLASSGSALISAGYGAAAVATARGSHGGQASVTGNAGLNITATGGNLVIDSQKQLSVRGGKITAAGQRASFTSSLFLSSNSTSSSSRVTHYHQGTIPTTAEAGTHGTATITGNAGVNLSAAGAVTLTQTGHASNVFIGAGQSAGARAFVEASSGATAKVNANAGLSITANSLTITGNQVSVRGGPSAAKASVDSFTSSVVTHVFSGGTTTGAAHIGTRTRQVSAIGTGAVAKLSADASVSITARTGAVTLTATGNGDGVNVSAGYGAVKHAHVIGGSGGSGSVSVKSGIAINAKTGFTAAALGVDGGVFLRGAGQSGSRGLVSAAGPAAKASLNANGLLTITAPVVTLSALRDVGIRGGNSVGYGAVVRAVGGGTAALNGNAGVAITAATSFSAFLPGTESHGSVGVFGGDRGGSGAHVEAHTAGNAALTANGDVNINGGNLLLSARNNTFGSMNVLTGIDTGRFGGATASGGGVALATLSGNVALNATGSLIVKAPNGNTHLGSAGQGSHQAQIASHAHVGASYGGKAALTANDNLSLTGKAVTIKAATFQVTNTHSTASYGGELTVFNGRNAAAHAVVGASGGGSAVLTDNEKVNIAAGGGLLFFKALGSLYIGNGPSCCSTHGVAVGAAVTAGGGNAKATLGVNNSVSLSGTAGVTITAAKNLSVTTVSGPNNAGVTAGFKGQASLTDNQSLTITTPGNFTAAAGESLNIFGGFGGVRDHAQASHATALATMTGLGSVNITANKLLLSGGTGASVGAGGGSALEAVVGASYGGVAAMTFNHNMNLTAKSGFSLTLTGQSNGGTVGLFGGAENAEAAKVGTGSGGGKATLTANADLNLTVTSANGAITVNAGKHKGAAVRIENGGSEGRALPFGPSAAFIEFAGRGGSANVNVSGNLNLSAKGAITFNAGGASGSLLIRPHGGDAVAVQITASSGGKAAETIQAVTSLNGGTVTLTAGGNISITGASVVASHAQLHAGTNGIAALTATTGVKIASKGAFTATAGKNLEITTNGSGSRSSNKARTARSAGVFASYGGAHATLTATDTVQINAATVSLAAANSLSISAGSRAAESAQVRAMTHNDKATLSADDSITINATGAMTLTGKSLFVGGGRDTASSAQVGAGTVSGSLHIPSKLATASLTATTGVNLKAGGAFTALASSVGLSNGGNIAGSLGVVAARQSDVAQAIVNGGININAATISLTARNGMGIDVNSMAGVSAGVTAVDGAQASLTANNGINLNATGAITLTAKNGDIDIKGGHGFFNEHVFVLDSYGGQATVQVNSGIGVHAGGSLSINAKHGNLQVSGGYGAVASLGALSGSANATIDTNVSLTAGKAMVLNAGGGALTIRGGGRAALVADLFKHSSFSSGVPAGAVQGTLNTGVNLTAGGNVTLTASGNVTIAAGAGETVAVGKIRKFGVSPSTSGNSWGGGSASLNANVGATVTAGKNLTVSAGVGGGSGNLQVLGLGRNPHESSGFFNIVSVRGGSSHAVANVSLNGNAALTAGSDIILNATGNASIAGGALFNVRADHTVGHITLTGSADATLHAGLDVMLNNIKGSLTLAGANVGPSGEEMLVDAHGNSGTVNVTGHADALISAGRDVVTVTALGRGLNLIAGSLADAVALGGASSQHATGTAGAAITAGRNVTISATGGLNLLGGNFDRASASASRVVNTVDSAAMTARADITAGTKAQITVGGDAFIAGGDSLLAAAKFSSAGFVVGKATADVGVGIQGGNVSVTVGGNLKARGGSGAKASVEAIASDAEADANANAGVNIAATGKTGTLAITVNGASASFLGGSGVTGKALVLFNGNSANATAHADLDLTAGGNMTLTIKGKLLVAGGPDADQFGTDIGGAPAGRLSASALPANNTTTSVTATGGVKFTAGGALTVAQAGGDLSILAGSKGASFASVNAVGSNAKTSLTVDTSVSITAGGALAFTGANNVNIVAGPFAAPSAAPFLVSSGPGARATATVDESVKLKGTSVHIGHTGSFNTSSSGSFTSGGVTLRGGFSSAAVATHAGINGVRTLGVLLAPRTEALHVAPMATHSSFGGAKTLSGMPVTDISDGTSLQPTALDVSGSVSVAAIAQPLATLQAASLVTSLVTLVGPEAGQLVSPGQDGKATLFTPALGSGDYSSSFSGACVALVVSRSGQPRCSAGGK